MRKQYELVENAIRDTKHVQEIQTLIKNASFDNEYEESVNKDLSLVVQLDKSKKEFKECKAENQLLSRENHEMKQDLAKQNQHLLRLAKSQK